MILRRNSIGLFSLVLAICALVAVFIYSVEIRKGTFNRFPAPGDSFWRTLQGQSLLFSRNWYLEGPLASGFAPDFRSYSVETAYWGRGAYLSYPPLFAIVPWAVASLIGKFPDLAMLMWISLVTHFISALLLLFLLYRWLQQAHLSSTASVYLAAVPSVLLLLVPGGLIFFQHTWWADIVVLPFILGLILLDSYLDEFGHRRWFRLGYGFLVLLGSFADWSFHLLTLCVLLRRLSDAGVRSHWKLHLYPMGAQLLFHLFTVLRTGQWENFISKIQVRTGLVKEGFSFSEGVIGWIRTIETSYGFAGLALYLGTLLFLPVLLYLFAKRSHFSSGKKKLTELAFLLLVPAHLHSFILHQHYYEHTYESLKFAFPLLSIAFALIPAFLWLLFRERKAAMPMIGVGVLAVGLVYAQGFSKGYQSALQGSINLDEVSQRVCERVALNTGFSDIIISPDFGTRLVFEAYTNEQRANLHEWADLVCYKAVYLILYPEQVKLAAVFLGWKNNLKKGSFRVRGLFAGEPPKLWQPYVTSEAPTPLSEGYRLYTLDFSAEIYGN